MFTQTIERIESDSKGELVAVKLGQREFQFGFEGDENYKRVKVETGIDSIFDNANLIIMCENSNNYKSFPYGWARYNKFITKHNNLFSDRRPDFYEL